jgi:hypothetical protein
MAQILRAFHTKDTKDTQRDTKGLNLSTDEHRWTQIVSD